ncbi:HD-GYP domain-containing protein [Alicyclobacillus dauci]|uniref:HD-GYP domain-containing protein n=1 Tax=Alicyclobacillus dauci TaxID=1475485 RepID=A0ABY6Z5J9_9BACL|nr:HD-GYP domain-containing protein [Alicyclobacillus dauci]WAH37559.1 HD-GYP domain-containing protein [Alicyclobacillus dauci]
MRKVMVGMDDSQSVRRLIGRPVPTNLISRHGALVLSKGQILTPAQALKAERHAITYMNERDRYEHFLQDVTHELHDVLHFVRRREQLPLKEIEDNISPLIMKLSQIESVTSLLNLLRAHDEYTVRHSVAVGVLSTRIGQLWGLDDTDLQALIVAATMHDIGKIKVPEEVLNKPGSLTYDEFRLMKQHTVYGYQVMEKTKGLSLRQALTALQHHERMDGSGYPFGSPGTETALFARIVAIADVFHAMISNRVYKKAVSIFEVLDEINSGKRVKYDMNFATVFLNSICSGLKGVPVTLDDGRRGTVMEIRQEDRLEIEVDVNEKTLVFHADAGLTLEDEFAGLDTHR